MDKHMPVQLTLSNKEFSLFADLIYQKAGINLTNEKRSLLVGRLQKLVRRYQVNSFSELYAKITSDPSGALLSEVVDNISTNHTYFYREKEHFDFFRNNFFPGLLSTVKSAGSKDIRIWSAGCSSGEEPYMIIMLMNEILGDNYKQWNAGILATDISEKILTVAKEGIYSDDRMDLLPVYFKNKYFTRVDTKLWRVKPNIQKEVVFRRFNLLNENYPFKKPFHAIFCRNVMIYFDQPTKIAITEKFYNCLEPGGMLFIGHSETLNGINSNFKYVLPAGYVK